MRNKNFPSEDHSYHAFLESLKGKVVTIYRGGPESKTGKLLDVQSDYVTLCAQNNNNNNNKQNSNENKDNNKNKNKNKNQDNDNKQDNQNQQTVIYYQAEHMKSISEDSKNNSMQYTQEDEEEVEFLQADHFAGLMEQLLNETVQINQGGPESKYGTLLGVSDDFIALYTEDDGIVYSNIRHIKSICKYQNNNQNDNEDSQENDSIQYPPLVEATDFHDVFRHLGHNWVSINRGGPEAMEGVLVENSGGHYTLVSNQEVLRIHPYHIKSISCGPKGSMNQQNQNNNSEDQNQTDGNEQTEQEMDESSSSSSSTEESYETKSSYRSRKRSRSSEKVVKTIDYVWKRSK